MLGQDHGAGRTARVGQGGGEAFGLIVEDRRVELGVDDHQGHARLHQTGQRGALGIAGGIVAEIGPLAVEQLTASEVVEAGDQDGAANAGPCRPWNWRCAR